MGEVYEGEFVLNTLYTSHCPQCEVLKNMLDKKRIPYRICEEREVMLTKGFRSVPMLEVDGVVMNCQQAFQWVKEK